MKVKERDLAVSVAAFFANSGGRVFAEVASLGKSADLVVVWQSEITFVEVKVNATSRAIEQCRAHELVADFICVATAAKSVNQANMDRLQELGYGLISCDVVTGVCSWILEPRRLSRYWQPIRDRVIDRLGGWSGH